MPTMTKKEATAIAAKTVGLLLALGANAKEDMLCLDVTIGGHGISITKNTLYGRFFYAGWPIVDSPVYDIKPVIDSFHTEGYKHPRFPDLLARAIDLAIKEATRQQGRITPEAYEAAAHINRAHRSRPSADTYLIRKGIAMHIESRWQRMRDRTRTGNIARRQAIGQLLALKDSLPTSLKAIKQYGARIRKVAPDYYRGDLGEHSEWGRTRSSTAYHLLQRAGHNSLQHA